MIGIVKLNELRGNYNNTEKILYVVKENNHIAI